MDNILLSICIATYNRADFIGVTLESIIPQLTEDIEIVIVDGGSTDHTEKIVNDYCKKFNSIRYFRLEKKGGIDQDYDKAVDFARGNYCWLFSDDDIIKMNTLFDIKDKLSQNPSLIIVNAELRNQQLNKVLKDRYLEIYKNEVYDSDVNSFENFFIKNAEFLSFIGCVIIKKDLWLSRDRISYYNTRFIHVGVIFQNILPNKIIVIHQPHIIIRLGNAEWTKLGFEIWMFYWPKLIHSFRQFRIAFRTSITPEYPFLKYSTLISQRAINAYQLENYKFLLSPIIKSKFRRFFSYLIAIIPRQFFLVLLLFYAVLKNNKVLKYNLLKSAA